MSSATNPPGVEMGPYTHGRWRLIAVTPEKKLVSDQRWLVAHINESGDVNLMGKYKAGFVEVYFDFDDLENLYRQAKRQRDKYTEGGEGESHETR